MVNWFALSHRKLESSLGDDHCEIHTLGWIEKQVKTLENRLEMHGVEKIHRGRAESWQIGIH